MAGLDFKPPKNCTRPSVEEGLDLVPLLFFMLFHYKIPQVVPKYRRMAFAKKNKKLCAQTKRVLGAL
jgi:hypothetical protein